MMNQSTEKMWAVVTHLGMMVLGANGIGALIIYLVFRDKSKYIAHHALQATWFFFVFWIAVFLLSRLGPLAYIVAPLGIVAFVMTAIASLNALAGRWYAYPLIGKFVPRAIGD